MTVEKLFNCRTCGDDKPAEEFRGDRRRPNGIDYECKVCRRKRERLNGEYLRARLRDFKSRKGDGIVLITTDQLKSLLTSHSCAYCGEQLTDENATMDHVYPLTSDYGGVNIVENIVQACKSCNGSKRNDHVADFYNRSPKFTTELWHEFARAYGSRLIGRELTELEGRQMARNLIDEAADLRRNAKPKEVACDG